MPFSYAHTAINNIRDTKSTVIKTLFTDETISKPLQKMVDAEADLAKAIVSTYEDMIAKFKVA